MGVKEVTAEGYIERYHWTRLSAVIEKEYLRLLKVSQMKTRGGESIGYPFTEFERGIMDVWGYWRDK